MLIPWSVSSAVPTPFPCFPVACRFPPPSVVAARPQVPVRAAGQTGWSFPTRFKLALTGLSAFSWLPLQFVTLAGLVFLEVWVWPDSQKRKVISAMPGARCNVDVFSNLF